MSKKLPNRGQRTKGVKLKNILQIGLLLGVCFWLIYQVKHSHDKRKEHDDTVTEISNKEQNSNLIRLGRKDLHPRVEEANNDKLMVEEDDDEGIRSQEEDNKRFAEVQKEEKIEHDLHKQEEDDDEEEENKNEDLEDAGRGGGDDEIDEHDQEQNEGEIDRDEEFIDEEKEREDEENEKEADETENKEGEMENESAEDQDDDGNNNGTHEAREENYKADDASSEVAHGTQLNTNDLGKLRLNSSNGDGDGERNILAQNDTSNHTAVSLKRNLEVVEGASSGNDSSFSVKNEETRKVSLSIPLNSSVTNLTTKTHLNDQPDTSNRSEQVTAELISNSTHILTTTFSQLNITESPLGILRAEKEVLDNPKTGQALSLVSVEHDLTNNVNTSFGSNQSSLNFTIPSDAKIAQPTIVDTSNSSANTESTLSKKDMGSKSTSKVADSYWSTTVKEDASPTLRKASSNIVDLSRTNGSMLSAFLNESEDAIQHDSSNFSMHEDKKEFPAGLATLPDAEGNKSNEVYAE